MASLKDFARTACAALIALLASAGAAEPIGPEGLRATYHRDPAGEIRGTGIERFTIALGPSESGHPGVDDAQWISLAATKKDGGRFAAWLLSSAYPPQNAAGAAKRVQRYILKEGDEPPREYLHRFTGDPVLPSLGAWEYLWPHAAKDGFDGGAAPASILWLGHRYILEGTERDAKFELPASPRRIELLPDILIGTPSNTRTEDNLRRYDGSDYKLVRLTRENYAEMIAAGMNCLHADREQAEWLKDEPVFLWGTGGADVLFPECLYRPTYLGATIHIDEPAVTTRDYVMRPRLAKDPALRHALTPQIMLQAFKEKYHEAVAGASSATMAGLKSRADVDLGAMDLTQRNLYAWETMIASAAWELSAEGERGPRAMVFEPPGRIGTSRTMPEMNMAYGCQIRPDDPAALIDIAIGFLRGAARATAKEWGVSIYGSVDRDDAPVWLTHAYDLGSKYFFFWDNYQSACVPYGESLALARHLRDHAEGHPERDHGRLRRAAEVAILLPPGYDLGHVRMGRGEMWGIGELNLERMNSHGVRYRQVMGAFFTEIERCMRLGVAFDLMWDLEGLKVEGYREVARVREDGRVEVVKGGERKLLDGPRTPERPEGTPPGLAVDLAKGAGGKHVARARVTEGSAPIYYTAGADRHGVHNNAMVFWELYGPEEEDCEWLLYPGAAPKVTREGDVYNVEIEFATAKPGRYRLRAGACDLAGRTTVVWTEFAE